MDISRNQNSTPLSQTQPTSSVPSQGMIDWTNNDPEYWEGFVGSYTADIVDEILEDPLNRLTRVEAIQVVLRS